MLHRGNTRFERQCRFPNYIIFVDDANRLSGFGYILDQLNWIDRGDIKIIVTVRQ